MAKGDDKKVRQQIAHQQDRYENQQGPAVNQMAFNYGRGSEADYGNYTDIMDRYRNMFGDGAGGGSSFGGSSVGASPITAQKLGPITQVAASNPFNSYEGYTEFSKTGGYSPEDIANMRARGVSPIRSAYANAERNIGQQRSLQGGYSPNAIAAQGRMAREQGQSMADATQNVEAGLATARNTGRLAGLGGMSDIEAKRLQAQMEGDMFNSQQAFAGNQFDISNQLNADQFNSQQGMQAGMFNAGQGNAAAQNQLEALNGMRMLYGTTPGMSDTFGNQLINMIGQGGQQGSQTTQNQIQGAMIPSTTQQVLGNIGSIANMAGGFMSGGLTSGLGGMLKKKQVAGPGMSGYTPGVPAGGLAGQYGAQMPSATLQRRF